MAAPISGRKGRVYADISSAANGSAQPIANLNTWSIAGSADRTETTSFGANSKSYVSGLRDGQGDFGGFWDTDGGLYNLSDGTPRKLYLYETSDIAGSYWFGTASFDISVTGTVGGAVEVSGSWAASTDVVRVQA